MKLKFMDKNHFVDILVKYISKKFVSIFAYKYIQAICLVSNMKKYFGDKMIV